MRLQDLVELLQASRVLESNEVCHGQGTKISSARMQAGLKGMLVHVAVMKLICQLVQGHLQEEAAHLPNVWDCRTFGSYFACQLYTVLSRASHRDSASARLTAWLCNPGQHDLLQQAELEGFTSLLQSLVGREACDYRSGHKPIMHLPRPETVALVIENDELISLCQAFLKETHHHVQCPR
jgi:hypothetical protein